MDPRLPVIIGVGQHLNRVDEGAEAVEPVELACRAVQAAVSDTGLVDVACRADTFAVVPIVSWRYPDPGRLVAERFGATPKATWYGPIGGNLPQAMLNRLGAGIAAGAIDLAVLCGAEAYRTRLQLKRADGSRPPWTVQDSSMRPTRFLGPSTPMFDPLELSVGLFEQTQTYPMFENALRASLGRHLDEHLVAVSELWAGFARAAAANPHAWDRQGYTAEQIRTVTPDNRMIGFPYTKLMVSNPMVEMSAAVIICSADRAQSLGVPRDKWVFFSAGTEGTDVGIVGRRGDLCASPAIRVAGARALQLAGVATDELDHVDVYSCYPSAVEVAASELGLAQDRPLSVWGGLTFGGGPWNNPVTHAVATMVERLRGESPATGLVTANGGNLGKHAFGIYSSTPPLRGFRWDVPQAEIDALTSRRQLVNGYAGQAEIATWTVMHDRSGTPSRAFALCDLPDGSRAWGVSTDESVLKAMVSEEWCGRRVDVLANSTFTLG